MYRSTSTVTSRAQYDASVVAVAQHVADCLIYSAKAEDGMLRRFFFQATHEFGTNLKLRESSLESP